MAMKYVDGYSSVYGIAEALQLLTLTVEIERKTLQRTVLYQPQSIGYTLSHSPLIAVIINLLT